MEQERVHRGVVVRIVATPASTEARQREAELALLRPFTIEYGDRRGLYSYIGDLSEGSRRRLGALFEAAERYGTELELGVSLPPVPWYEPVLAQPVPVPGRPGGSDEDHGFVEPANVDTMLVTDVQHVPGGPIHHWWLSAEPPRGTHPDPEGAWAALCELASSDPFGPPPDTYTYLRPRQPGHATVQGIWRGRWVQAAFSRQTDEEIARWERLTALLEPRQGLRPTPA